MKIGSLQSDITIAVVFLETTAYHRHSMTQLLCKIEDRY